MLSKGEVEKIYWNCANSVEYFGYYFFPHILSKSIAEFHKEVYQDLLRSEYYACAAPRGHAKSTLGLVINSMHFALFRKVGDVTLLSASESFVINEIVRIIKREFEQNEKLHAFFGELKTAKWSETYFVLSNGIAFEAGGIGGQLRGGRRGLIALDDLESNETVESEEQRNKLKNRINKELIPKLLPKGQMAYFGTVIHTLCYLKQILDTPNNGWKKRIYKSYVDEIELPGHELWAGMLPHAELQRRKAIMGSHAFQAEYMNNPTSAETAPIKDAQIRYWDELPAQLSCVIAIDPAYTEDLTRDFKVAVLVGMDASGNRYLISYLRNHAPAGEFMDGVLNLYGQYKGICTAIGCPSGGTEKEFYRSLVNKATERRIYPPFVELKNTFVNAQGEAQRNKQKRIIASLQPLFEAGKYYIHHSHQEAKEELLTVGSSRWDDLVDALAYAEQILTPAYFELGEVSEDNSPAMAGKSSNYGMDD